LFPDDKGGEWAMLATSVISRTITFNFYGRKDRMCKQIEVTERYTALQVETRLADKFPVDSMFDSLNHASECFHGCPVGISPSIKPKQFKTIQLKTMTWALKPLQAGRP
jgi:hypothetical protein